MPTYDVSVSRTETRWVHVHVEANDRQAAADVAMAVAGDQDFHSGRVSDPSYEVDDVTEVNEQGEADAQVPSDDQED